MASDDQSSVPANDASLDFFILKEAAKNALIDALNSVNGAKTLSLDASLSGPLGLVTDVSLLKHHGVDKMFWLEPGPLNSTTPNIVYLCRPTITNVKVIAGHVKRHSRESQKYTYTIFFVPRVSTLVTRILEEEGVLGDVVVSTYNLQFIPLAEDVVSLERDSAFKELWVDGDETIIYDSFQALNTLQKYYGTFPRILGKGDHAARLATLLDRQNSVESSNSDTHSSPSEKIDSLIILDRRVDLITPLLTQLTYEGLVDELVGIKNSHVELPASLVNPPPAPAPSAGPSTSPTTTHAPVASLRKEAKKKYHLTTTNDPLLSEIRDLNFASVGKKLNLIARRLDEDYKARLQAKTVAQLRDFVGKLGGLQTEHQSLRLHTGLSEMLVPLTHTEQFNKSLEIQQNLLASYNVSAQLTAIEDLIAQGADMQVVLRLMCLASITTGGIKVKVLEGLKREILQAYGYNYLPLLLSLASSSLSMLVPSPPSTTVANTKYPFVTLRKSLRLLIDDNPEALDEVENDISFVYSGWAPISVRLVQCVAQKGGVLSNPAEKDKPETDNQGKVNKVQAHPIVGWKGFEDVISTIPGETVDIVQKSTNAVIQPVASLRGCTYTEIAALRWVARQNRGRKFCIATTSMVSGASIIESIAGVRKAGPKDAGI
ncbi:hypothetical protein ONZ45_g4174 [Pleurotus djamor]|nr:hypothetical protein ONZ45_g4174 [Pleurotus djamor]